VLNSTRVLSEHVYYVQNEAGTILYAVLTEWPGQSVLLKYAKPLEKSDIHLLGFDQELQWEDQQEEGILIQLPEAWHSAENPKVKHAYVIKMKGKQADVAEAPEIKMNGNIIKHKTIFSDSTLVELSTETKGAKIYYTLDNSKPDSESHIYDQALVLTKSIIIRAISNKDKYVSSLESSVDFMQTEAFSSIEYKNPYSEKYPALGKLSLGDGIFGDESNYAANWLGFDGVDFYASIDLGTNKTVSTIKVDFLESIKSWIFLPESIEIKTSKDGKNYQLLKSVVTDKPRADRKAQSHMYEIEIPAEQVRYVQVIGKSIGVCPEWHTGAGSPSWIFVDEIVIQ